MNKKQLSILILLVLYTSIGVVAAGLLFFVGSGKKQSSAFSPSSIEAAEKDIIIEKQPEAVPEDLQEDLSEDENITYYKFLTTNILTPLNVRLAPGLDATIIGTLPPASTGYVLEKGDEWTKIKTDNLEGYCSNQYLFLEEISKEEYPY